MSQIRSFVAIDLTPPIKVKLEEIQNKLRSSPSDVRWVKTVSIHLTLKFLGDIEEERVAEVAETIIQGTAAITPFNLTVRTLGAFPSERNPKVIWVGAEDKTSTLQKLQHSLEKRLSAIGFKEEKRGFSPHLTLGRLKSSQGKKELTQRLTEYKECECGTFEVQEINLYKSELKPSGAVYTKLKVFPLHPD